jgi:hypothetical protein
MAKLYLKGVNKPITISKTTAMTINLIIDNENIPRDRQFNHDGVRFMKADIRYVIENDFEDDKVVVDDSRKQENDAYYTKLSQEHSDYICKRCFMTVEEKAKDTTFFETIYFGVAGKKPDEYVKSLIIEKQRAYFTGNPRHPFAKINFFKLIDNLPSSKKENFDFRYNIASGAIRIAEKVIQTAFGEAHKQGLLTAK